MPFQRPVRPVKTRKRASRSASVGGSMPEIADSLPIDVAEARGTVLANVERSMDHERKKEENKNSDQHFSNGVAHGFGMRPGFGTEYGVCHRACTMAMRHTRTLKAGNVDKSQ